MILVAQSNASKAKLESPVMQAVQLHAANAAHKAGYLMYDGELFMTIPFIPVTTAADGLLHC